MKRIIPVVVISALAALGGGCHFGASAKVRDAGPAVDRSYTVGAFDRIAVAGPYDVTVRTGGQPSVTVRGGKDILDETEVIVDHGELRIKAKDEGHFRWHWGKDGRVKMVVTTGAIREAALAGSGGLDLDRATGDAFKASVAGSGDMAIGAVATRSADFSVAGSGAVRAGGQTAKLGINIAGSGNVDLAGLSATDANVSIAGSGKVRAHATGTAAVAVMGSGDVEVSGGARCSVSKHGSGDVRCS